MHCSIRNSYCCKILYFLSDSLLEKFIRLCVFNAYYLFFFTSMRYILKFFFFFNSFNSQPGSLPYEVFHFQLNVCSEKRTYTLYNTISVIVYYKIMFYAHSSYTIHIHYAAGKRNWDTSCPIVWNTASPIYIIRVTYFTTTKPNNTLNSYTHNTNFYTLSTTNDGSPKCRLNSMNH